MRALRVIGLHEDGKSIVCEDPARGERFLLPADEKLRAAARGDITRLGQIEIELESQMRPREIQTRIRAGESLEHVAASAGVPVARIERFAYPVLLERARMAELAQLAHPIREDGPDVRTLGEVVSYAFTVRGQDYSQATWDAWRGDDLRWIVRLHWRAGRTDNAAHWAFTPGAHGGTMQALDENAEEILDPNANRTPRTLRAVTGIVRSMPEQPTLDSVMDSEPTPEATEVTQEFPCIIDDDPVAPEQETSQNKKKGHPSVPSWEDVLLGVRSQRG